MYMLVRMSQHVTHTQDAGSFLSVTFASSLVKVKRNFDKFVVSNHYTHMDLKLDMVYNCNCSIEFTVRIIKLESTLFFTTQS